MMKSHYLLTGVIVLSQAAFAATCLQAEEFPQTIAAAQSSAARGFTQSSLPALHRYANIDRSRVNALLSARFCSDCANGASGKAVAAEAGTRSSLTISADGTSVQFEDARVRQLAHSQALPVSKKMTLAALEQAGRAFIGQKLAEFITLGPGEKLVPVRTDYRIEGLQDLTTGEVTRSVVANRIVFGRTIQGVPVVGNGSTVVMTFTNDGSLESFHYDWSQYEATNSQDLVDAASILNRVQAVMGVRSGVTPNFAVSRPELLDSAHPLALTSEVSLQKLECGYYDRGSEQGASAAAIQPGCVYHAVSETQGGIRQGYAGAVPAGLQFGADNAWLETKILSNPAK